jgi:hypothetical protein
VLVKDRVVSVMQCERNKGEIMENKSRLNTAIYHETHLRLQKIAKHTGKPMIQLMDEAISDLENKISQDTI